MIAPCAKAGGLLKIALLALVFLMAIWGSAQAPSTPQKPMTAAQVEQLVEAGVDNARIAQAVEDRGIDFFPTEQFISTLRSKGAKQPLIDALQASMPPCLSKAEILRMVAQGNHKSEIPKLVGERGVSFNPTAEDLDTLRIAGADQELLEAVRNAPLYVSPIPIYKPEPDYTPEAFRAKVQGFLELRITIDNSGNVTDVRELSTPLGKGLDERAIKTVRTWRFKPATRNGKPVAVRTKVEISFSLVSL
jgi:TonB family protein